MSQLDVNNIDVTDSLEKLTIDDEEIKDTWGDAGMSAGIRIWRIENFKVVPWPESEYGKFFSGDSYIVLKTTKVPNSNVLHHDIHFWLGTETTQDEAGTAAYKTVELDDYLGGGPVQHREVQGFESKLFLSYFQRFIIMEGGIDSGFNKVKPIEYKPQLFHIKSVGKTLTVTSVPITFESLNNGDVFVLDEGLKIYQWNGCKASGIEKHKAMEFTSSLKSERDGKPEVKVFDQDDHDAAPFWKGLGGKGTVKDDPDSYSNGKKKEEPKEVEKVLFRLSDASGTIEFKEEARGDLKYSMLDSNDVFIVDVDVEVFVWIGSGSSVKEKMNSLQYAMDYVKSSQRPLNVPITRVVQGNENVVFKSFFNQTA